jgi:hypothetical protein
MFSYGESLIEVDRLYIETKWFSDASRNPLIDNGTGRRLDKEINLNFNVDLFTYFYWNNKIHSLTDQSLNGREEQFRLVNWQFQIGFRLFEFLDLEYGHSSKHLLDSQWNYAFPVEDYVGFRLYFYRSDRPIEKTFIPYVR